MAIRTSPTPVPMPSTDDATYAPSPGMTFTTFKAVRHVEAFSALEHPADWTNDQILAAIARRSSDILGRVCFWDADEESTVIEEVYPGKYEPDEVEREPMALTEADLVAAPAPVIVETPPES